MHNKKDNKSQILKRNIINKTAIFTVLFCCSFLFSGCGRIADLFLVRNDDTPYVVMESMENSMEESGQEETESEAAERKTYMTMLVEDYEIAFQDGAKENTLDLWLYRDGEEWLVNTYEILGDQQSGNFTAETFQDVLGHNGFRVFNRRPLGTSYYYYETEYYAMEEEPVFLAYRWGTMDGDTYQLDVDGDGIDELICNVQWMADGVEDVLIYHYDGEKVWQGYGSDLLDENFVSIGIGSMRTKYLPLENKMHIWYWQEEIHDYAEKDYEIDLDKINLWEFHGN